MEEKIQKNNKKTIFFGIFTIIFIIFSAFLLISCGKEKIPPKEILISKTQTTLFLGQRKKLDFQLNPENSNYYNIVWSSSNPKIVSVNQFGYIDGLKYGSATIVVKDKESGIFAQCKVVVNDGEVVNLKAELPYKIYYEGQTFDYSSIQVNAVYESGKEVQLNSNEYTIECDEVLALDSKIIVKISQSKTITLYPFVIEDFVTEIELTTPPTKTSYTIGEKFSVDGMEVSHVYASGKRVITQEYNIDTDFIKYNQNQVKISYQDFEISLPIEVNTEITVNSISSLQKAINDGYKSIKLSSAIYSTSNQIVLSNIENLVIIGEDNTEIKGYNISPIKIEGNCGNITLVNLTLSSVGDNPTTDQIDLKDCLSGNIILDKVNYSSILHSEEGNYNLNVI